MNGGNLSQLAGIRAHAERSILGSKGALVAHLIGFSVFFAIFAGLLFPGVELPYTRVIDIPIRFVALWLFLDRFGRFGRYRLTMWDTLYGFLAIGNGVAFIYADLYMIRFSGGNVYVEWLVIFLTPLLFFAVVREASFRKGFRPEIVFGWLVGTAALAGVMGLVQALDVAGARQWSATVFHWVYYDRQLQGPSEPYQGRGPFQHANGLSVMMVFSLCLVPACLKEPRFKKLALPLFVLVMAAIFSTYSRIGIVSAGGVFGAFVLFLLLKKRVIPAVAALGGAVLLAFAFVAAIYIFDIQRFKIFVEGEGVVARAKGDEIGGWYLRQDANEAAVKKALEYPIMGVGATGAGINRMDKITSNPYSYRFLTTNAYTYAWVSYGFVGLLFVLAQIGLLGYIGFSNRISSVYAVTFLMLCAALAVTAAAENTNFNGGIMSFTNVMIALYGVPALLALPRARRFAPTVHVPPAPLTEN